MKRLISYGAALLLTVGSALAADLPMPTKAPPPPPPPLWTGLFLGPAIGGNFGKGSNDVSGGKDLFCGGGVVFCSTPLSEQNFFVPGSSGNNGSFAGGGQLGYNYQLNPSFVVGGVADLTVFDRSADTTFTTPPLTIAGHTTETRSYTDSIQSNWLATFRLRGGPTFDKLWIYGTGGLALADLRSSSSSVTTWNDPSYTPPSQNAASGSGSASGPALGWVVGAGAEYKITPNWGIFGEYLYYSVSRSYTVSVTPNTGLTGITASSSYNVDAKVNGSLVKLGLNYTFATH